MNKRQYPKHSSSDFEVWRDRNFYSAGRTMFGEYWLSNDSTDYNHYNHFQLRRLYEEEKNEK